MAVTSRRQAFAKLKPVVMGPGLRRDDHGACGSRPALLQIRQVMRDGRDLLLAHMIGDVGHRSDATADTLAGLVIAQRFDQIFLALARQPRDGLGAGIAVRVT